MKTHPIHPWWRGGVVTAVAAGALTALGLSALPAAEDRPAVTPEVVLTGLRAFYAKTALADGSFRPGIDPDYAGDSDSGFSDLAPVAYAVVIHKTFGWELPHEGKTRELLLSRQQPDGAFVNVGGKADPKSAQARLYNTCQGLVALHALGVKPRHDPLPVLEALLAADYRKFPAYTTSFFPLAYQAAGRRFPPEADRKIRALLAQADDGYLQDHIAATYHLVHYYRLLGEPTPRAGAIVARVLRDQKADGGWNIKAPDWDVHAAFDALFVLRQLGKGGPQVRRAMDRATRWVLSCRNADGGFGHFPGRRSDADAVYFQAGALVMTGFLPPADPLPKDPHLYAWGHLFPTP
jgi:geranylgeranyl transferase type-2 subunit beta